jgi:hypothetical protein
MSSSLQKIIDRLEFLLDKEKVDQQEMKYLAAEFRQAGMAEELRTENSQVFCMDLLATLSELTPWAIGTIYEPEKYDTAQDLVDAMIPSNHHLD